MPTNPGQKSTKNPTINERAAVLAPKAPFAIATTSTPAPAVALIPEDDLSFYATPRAACPQARGGR
jgi:hypothetical protein